MTTNHIDQLAQWYADAERITDTNLPRIGDTLIFSSNANGYTIEVEEDDWTPDIVMPGESVRILARATKPKPAWHDAVVVRASSTNQYFEIRTVWARDGEGWMNTAGEFSDDDDLIDPVPLIEAKVTDEMVLAALNASTGLDMLTMTSFKRHEIEDTRLALTAALGLETE